ncbi:hypothetical protein ATI61_102333 [Archangium gephyra]|uniref:Uncharacterized protein n=1 Tax=Archangium gephyra TaxID=48 RepID=A0ABX9K8U5_9BACT|nr:hypothetical protein [Archangium gephyra]REG35959.1 hypothetical protein ATI61_102333 [Archangium gephyra]
MTTLSDLADAHPVIGRRWSPDQSPEQKRILCLARDALDFIFATGQRYDFEDFFNRPDSRHLAPRGGHAELSGRMDVTKRFFEKIRDEPELDEEVAQSQAILDAIQYIESTGQQEALAAFQQQVESNDPPFVVASFDTRADAEAWLVNHPHPPDPASVLIANEYHDVVHDRETNIRRLPRSRALKWYLEDLMEKEQPVPVASFETREQADAWWRAQSESPRWAWVRVGGELYLAAYYPNIQHRALFPLSLVNAR